MPRRDVAAAVAGVDGAGALSTGSPVLDELIDGVRVGDNLVFVSSSDRALQAIGRAFVAVSEPQRLVVAATEPRALLAIPTDALLLDRTDGAVDADALIAELAAADVRVGGGASFLVDSLTGVQSVCGSQAALQLFLAVCPQLYRRGSVAMWLLDASAHDAAFLDRIEDITQVVVRLDDDGDGLEAEVLAAAGRGPTTIGRRQRLRVEDGTLTAAGPAGAGRDRLGELVRGQRVTRGLSQAELARRVGVTPSALSQVERGVRGLSAETLMRIWEALGVPFGPDDTVQRGYRIARRGGHRDEVLADGVVGRLRYDEVGVGRCWEVQVAPGGGARQRLFADKGTETVVLLRGVLDLQVGGHAETLHEGDSLVARQATIERVHNPGSTPSVALWSLLP